MAKSRATQDKEAVELYRQKLEMVKSGATVNPFETKAEQLARIERAKKDVKYCVEYYFSHYAGAECADFHLQLAELIRKDATVKVIVKWGRGLAKSVWADIVIPFWLWMRSDISYMVLVGNNFDKAKILLQDLQAEFEANPRIIHDFGVQFKHGSWEKGYYQTTSGFIAKALGMGQSPRGLRVGARRPDYIVCDDLEDRETIKNPARQKEVATWIEKDLIPTMDGPRRRYLHPNNDFAPVTIQKILEERHPNWRVHRVDACPGPNRLPRWHQKYPADYYQEMEAEIGTLALEAEFNNNGVIVGELFKEEMINWAKAPQYRSLDHIVGFWDVAWSGKNDYNAISVWGIQGRQLWKLKQFCKLCKIEQAIEWMYEMDKVFKTATVHWRVEAQFWNDQLFEAFFEAEKRHGYALNILMVNRPSMKKFDRILLLHPMYQLNRISYDEKEKGNNDMQIANSQLFAIEPGYKTHDDAPDADEQAINELLQFAREERFIARTTSRAAIISKGKNRW